MPQPVDSNHSTAVLAFDAFHKVTETLRYQRFFDINQELWQLYAILSDSRYLISKLVDTADNSTFMSKTPQAEIEHFIIGRLIFFCTDMLKYIKAYIGGISNDLMTDQEGLKWTVTIGGRKFKHHNLSQNDLNAIEYEINRICDHIADFQQHDDGTPALSRYDIPNIKNIIIFLIKQFDLGLKDLLTFPTAHQVIELNRAEIRNATIHTVCMTAYLLIKCVKSYLQITTELFNISATVKRQMQYLLIGEELARYSQQGTAPFQNILCCYKNMTILPMVTTNPQGSFNTNEKEFLLSILILSKMM